MALFPGALPAAGTASPGATLAASGHTSLHNTGADESRAIASKVGTGASTPTSGVVLRGDGVGTSSWGQVVLTTDVTGVLPLQSGGTNATTAAAARTSLGVSTPAETLAAVYPIGCIYTEITGINPNSTFGFGTWVAYGEGRVLVGNGTSDATYAAGATGGESTHVLTSAEMPAHTHPPDAAQDNFSSWTNDIAIADTGSGVFGMVENPTHVATTGSSGGGGAHNNLQPYIVVYFWRRTA
jgi:hypothetical protein